MAEEADVYSKQEVARRLKISRDSVDRAIRRGDIRVLRLGRLVRIPRRELARVLAGDGPIPAREPR